MIRLKYCDKITYKAIKDLSLEIRENPTTQS